MSMVYLSHLSKDNNSPHLALEYFSEHAEDTDIVVASRYKETPVYQVPDYDNGDEVNTIVLAKPVQMSLF